MNNHNKDIELEKLLAEHKGLIVSQAVSFCRNPDDLDDFISVGTLAFTKAYKKYIPIINGKEIKFSTYIVSCIRNAFKKHCKKEEKRYFTRPTMSYIDSEQLWELLPDDLTEQEQVIIQLKYENYSYQEISDITGLTQKELQKITHKLFRKIRECNEEESSNN